MSRIIGLKVKTWKTIIIITLITWAVAIMGSA